MQQHRNVYNMLPSRTKTKKLQATTSLSMLIITVTTLLFATFDIGGTAAAATVTTLATPVAAAAFTTNIAAIGATSLAAAAAAETAIAASLSASHTGGGSSSSDEIAITAQSSANLLLEDMQHPGNMVNLTRHHDGDIFSTTGVTHCNADTCVGLSSGTAGLVQLGGDKHDISSRTSAVGSLAGGGAVGHSDGRMGAKRGKLPILGNDVGSTCDCRCLPYLSTYREDLGICVDDIHECTLSPFVSGSSSEKIPFVFLPLRGQIIYPSREISFPDIRTPVCAVTGAQYLTTNGWTDLRNPIDTDYPFRMFRDEGRTFLQWLGEPDLRQKMQGRLIVVHLVCRDMMLTLNATKDLFKPKPPKNVFSPCVAFRVNGSPVKYFHNVSEVLFQAETTSTLAAASSDGMSTKEYVVIGVCSLLLGLIYVSSVFLYLHMKKRKTREQSHMRNNSLDDLANEINYPKNDQVTFGAPFNRSGSIYSGTSLATTSNEPRSRASIGSAVGVHLKGEEMGIVKSNPLLQHFPQLSELHSGFTSDISNSNSECEMDSNGGGGGPSGYNEKLKQLQTAALVHPASGNSHQAATSGQNNASNNSADSTGDNAETSSQDQECLPVENVSIVEDMMTEEKLEQMRAMINGTVRKKLYFNPAYFEPHLLAQPPPAAIEFLTKIREVIAIAKYKMATKRYQPSLIVIPEEGPLRSSTPSLYSSQLQMSGGTDGCRGCATNRCSGHIKNCGDKRNSIEKWLQSVPLTDTNKTSENQSSAGETHQNGEKSNEEQTHSCDKSNGNQQQQQQQHRRHRAPPAPSTPRSKAAASQQRKEISPPKQRPPPPPTPTPQSNSSQSKSAAPSPLRPHVIEIRHDNSPYELHNKASKHGSSSVTVNRSFDALSAALSNAANIYGFAEMGGEIYNNPKFSLHDSPSASQRSRSSSHRSKSSRKRLEVLDQYAAASTPTSLNSADREHYEMLRNMKQAPDMVYDAIARDYNATLVDSNCNYHLDIPTPDYDSTLEKKIKDIYYNTALSSAPSVPTPDYSTLSKKSLRQCQPDSPIYRRKSPQYLIVDYETDSLERLAASKRKSSQSSSSPSSDVSSQLSPSLSTALPLEEELEISHTVYDKVNGFRKEGNMKKKVAAKPENTAAKQKEIEARIKYDTPFHGSMTIEVEHEPPSDMELSTDSDQYEPDTLDRKPKKHSFCDVNAWSEHMQKAKNFVNEQGDCDGKLAVSYHHLENMNSLPELRTAAQPAAQTFMLCPSNSFRSETPNHGQRATQQCRQHSNVTGINAPEHEQVSRRPSFESLREIYQSKLVRQHSQSSQGSHGSQRSSVQQQAAKVNGGVVDKGGRLLTLEAKHSRRQRLMEQKLPPPEIETEVVENKTTIKIRTPTMNRPVLSSANRTIATSSPIAEVHNGSSSPTNSSSTAPSTKQSGAKPATKGFYELTKNFNAWNNKHNESDRNTQPQKKRPPPASPPPAPPPTSASTTLTSQRSMKSERSERSERSNASSLNCQHLHRPGHFYQNQTQYQLNQLTINSNGTSNATEEETASNHSESTEVTGVSDTQANSEFGGSCNNTLSNDMQKPARATEATIAPMDNISLKVIAEDECNHKSRRNSISSNHYETPVKSLHDSPQVIKKLQEQEHVVDYRAYTPTPYNGLRNDYSLNKYLNRRKSHDHSADDDTTSRDSCNDTSSQLEANNNTKNVVDTTNDAAKLLDRVDVISLSSRSNRSSSRLSDRTKEMYRNAGVPVGIAYPQRSNANSNNNNNSNSSATTATTNVQTVYRCEIEPMQLTHGMQIAMGLKDRAKKAKDLKNAWKKFVSMAAAKFSPTASPAPPFEKKTAASFLEALERDEGISSLIDDHPQVSTPKSSYSAPASQNYYEQRFGTARLQEMDSGYMSADSGEVYKRSFYDRYNFRMMSGRDRVIRVDTIEDNSDGASTLTERQPEGSGSRRASILDSNRFEDFEHMGEPPEAADSEMEQRCDSDADSDKTLTRTNAQRISGGGGGSGTQNIYSSEDERGGNSGASCGSSETDGETNVEDMWESGAESIETHSVLYKNVRKK